MSNPNQEIIESRLATYIDGELDPAERLEIEQHLQQNPQYRRVIDDLRKQRDMLRGLPREAAPLDLAEAFTNQLERSVLLDYRNDKNTPRMRIHAMPRLVAAAAIIFLTVGLAAIVYFVLPERNARRVAVSNPSHMPLPVPAGSTDETPSDDKPHDLPAATDDRLAMKSGADKSTQLGEATTPAPLAISPSSPELDAKPPSATAFDATAARSETRKAFSAMNRNAEGSAVAHLRDGELDRLALEVSKDARVKQLLAPPADAKGAAAIAPANQQNAPVLVVRANDPRQVETALANLFSRDKIEWHPAPPKVALALNTSLSADASDALRRPAESNKQDIDLQAVETATTPLAMEKRASVAMGRPPGVVGPGQAAAGSTPAPATYPENLRANDGAAPGSTASSAPQPNAPAFQNIPAKDAAGKSVNAALAEPALVASRGAATFGEPVSQLGISNIAERQQAMTPNLSPIENMYVVRHLSRLQVEQLNACLATTGDVRATDVDRRLSAFADADKVAPTMPAAAAPQAGVFASGAAKPSAVGGPATQPAAGINTGELKSIAGTAPISVAPSTLGNGQNGQAFGANVERARSVAATAPAANGDQIASAALGQDRPLEKTQTVLRSANNPGGPQGADAAIADAQKRRASVELSAKIGTAAPLSDNPAETGTLDVVIVVQKRTDSPDTILAAPPAASITVPATAPATTRPAASTISPSTRPSIPGT